MQDDTATQGILNERNVVLHLASFHLTRFLSALSPVTNVAPDIYAVSLSK